MSRVALTCALLGPILGLACTHPSAEGEETGSGESTESGDGGEYVTLIDHLQWQFIDNPADDPLASHRPAMIDCGLDGWLNEQGTLEVRTNFCNYIAVSQPSLMAVEQGQMVQVIFYHFDLVAAEPAQGHVAILLDGQIIWEKFIDIPGDADVYTDEFPSPISAEKGAPIVFHLHNHGQNSWVLQDLLAMQ